MNTLRSLGQVEETQDIIAIEVITSRPCVPGFGDFHKHRMFELRVAAWLKFTKQNARGTCSRRVKSAKEPEMWVLGGLWGTARASIVLRLSGGHGREGAQRKSKSWSWSDHADTWDAKKHALDPELLSWVSIPTASVQPLQSVPACPSWGSSPH